VGPRRAELMGAKVADLDFDLDVLLVLGKGRRERALPFGRKTTLALDRYLRARARHKDAALPWLWLGLRGRFTARGWSRCCATAGRKPAFLGCTRTSSATPSPTSGSPKAVVKRI
jgi:site-specific recombinase XerD